MIKIALQAGHMGRTTGSTGAPGEQELTARIWNELSKSLIARGFQLFLFNADPKNDPKQAAILGNDYDLFLALHGDADYAGDNGGGFADYPEPSTDGATAESQRICKVINDNYFAETGIAYTNHSNANTRYYYMWKYLSAKTPCVIIEMGQVQDPHDKVLLGNTALIVNALSRSICKAFGVNYEAVPTPAPTIDQNLAIIEGLKNEVLTLKSALSTKDTECADKLAQLQQECSNYRLSDRVQMKADIKKWVDAY